MFALILDWLLLSVGSTVYLLWRLRRDWRAARFYTRQRIMMLRFIQGFRLASSMCLSKSGYEKTAERMRLF